MSSSSQSGKTLNKGSKSSKAGKGGLKRKKGIRSDFSFALNNPDFADCTLRIHAASEENGSKTQDMVVSSLVLVSNSPYFEKMLTGSFKETKSKHIDIRVAGEEVPLLLNLIHFMYSGGLPEEVVSSFGNILKLLVVADRFEAIDCVVACAEALDKFLAKLNCPQAISILSLPEHIKQQPSLLSANELSRLCIVREFGELIATPEDDRFLSLPETAFSALLASPDLVVKSENTLLIAAWKWVGHNHGESSKIDAFCQLVLPHIRLTSLTPRNVDLIITWIRRVLEREAQADTRSESSGVGKSELVRKTALDALREILLDFSIKAVVESGSVPQGSSFDLLLDNMAQVQATKPHQTPPELRLYLDIRRKTSGFCLPVETAPGFIDGRWFILSASRDTKLDTLKLTLTWQIMSSKELSPKEFNLRFTGCIQTSRSSPAYEGLFLGSHKFSSSNSRRACTYPNALGKTIHEIVEDPSLYCPKGAIRLRLDVWPGPRLKAPSTTG